MQESQEMQAWSLAREDPLAKEMQPIPVFLPGKSHGQRSLEGYTPQWSQRVGHDWAALPSLIPKNSSAVLSFLFSHPLPGWNKHPGPRGGAWDEKEEAWVHESLQEGTRSEQKEHKMLLSELGINFYRIRALWELFVMVVCLPCEVECLFKKCSFPSLSHHEWTTHLHSTDGWFGLRDVNRHGML